MTQILSDRDYQALVRQIAAYQEATGKTHKEVMAAKLISKVEPTPDELKLQRLGWAKDIIDNQNNTVPTGYFIGKISGKRLKAGKVRLEKTMLKLAGFHPQDGIN